VFQLGGGLGFGAEAFHLGLIGETSGQHHLERDDAVEADLPRAPHDSHAAVGDFFQQFEIAESEGRSLVRTIPSRSFGTVRRGARALANDPHEAAGTKASDGVRAKAQPAPGAFFGHGHDSPW
jgi:hypothetical protein